MARTAQVKRRRTTNFNGEEVEVLSISSDSSEEVVVEYQGTQDVTNEVVVASEVVEAQPVKTQDEEVDEVSSSDESSYKDPLIADPHIRQWAVNSRVADGEATVNLLEQDFLDGLRGLLKHKKDPFRKLRFGFGETDWEYCYGYNQDLDYRIDRLKDLTDIAKRYEVQEWVNLYCHLDARSNEE